MYMDETQRYARWVEFPAQDEEKNTNIIAPSSDIRFLSIDNDSATDKHGEVSECSISDCKNNATMFFLGDSDEYNLCTEHYSNVLKSRSQNVKRVQPLPI